MFSAARLARRLAWPVRSFAEKSSTASTISPPVSSSSPTSAQLAAAAASNPAIAKKLERKAEDDKILKKACGDLPPPGSDEPEMVDVRNPITGEVNGPRGLEPTRYNDWESKGRCWDF